MMSFDVITEYFIKGKSEISRVKTKNLKRYIIGFRPPKNSSTQKFFSSSLSSSLLPDLSLLFSFSLLSFFSSFPLLFPFSPPTNSCSGELREPGAAPRRIDQAWHPGATHQARGPANNAPGAA